MGNQGSGGILCSQDLDDNVSLQIWRGEGAPRLGIYNKTKERMKPVRFSWLEDPSRVLKMQHGRGQSTEYDMDSICKIVRGLLESMSRDLTFRSMCLRTAVLLQDMAIVPKVVMDKKDFALLPETKRRSLWLTDLSDGKNNGAFLPCFDVTDEESELFLKNGDELYLDLPKGADIRDIRSTSIVSKLTAVDPVRWYMPFQIGAMGVLMGFSAVGGESIDFADSLWRGYDKKSFLRKVDDLEGQAKVQASKMAMALVSLVRHWPYLQALEYREHYDSEGDLKERGYSRKRRFDIPQGQLGDISYVVTVYDNGEGHIAIGCKGNGRTSLHDGDMIFEMPDHVYGRSMASDACGSSPDETYSIVSLIRAWRTYVWCRRVKALSEPALMGYR
ncbi:MULTISPECIES: hypothetical protein [Dethiosulfovibrio]|uniref:Uncharacterized protein n=2 Tax=Dethiosulfovibrio TaxID=47054 RepID=A0ABS9ESY4_9BACT|nr:MULTISPECIES: hypothetical protein [Dethiosulfovibrio]MCF4114369.1 hypothetical protein [Dethiosulfovibrio russensis]MCF4142970.1 hypothetical protein [Dethiosulfovibrio marinus]MCF4145067.1 hypothetical protein [Dethiosulfovibrio acidaminovorans]